MLAQISTTFIIDLIQTGFLLGGTVGAVLGIVTWTFAEKQGLALPYILSGGAVGLLLGFILVGSGLLTTFSSIESLFYSADQNTSATFLAIIGLFRFVLTGAAIGGAVASFRRGIVGALVGLFAGTMAGIILFLVNGQLRTNISGPIATIMIAVVTMILLSIILYGRSSDRR